MAIYRRVEDQQDEIFVVLEAHAVVDPWAVVVHPQNTLATDAAVVAAIRLVLRTPFASSLVASALLLLKSFTGADG
jgi:hypothetical protein